MEAFVPAHQRKSDESSGDGKAANFRVGLRKLPWVDTIFPPEPAVVEEFYEGADADVLGAGYHEGATYYELEDFVRQGRLFAPVASDLTTYHCACPARHCSRYDKVSTQAKHVKSNCTKSQKFDLPKPE